jgi:hypothetical protein
MLSRSRMRARFAVRFPALAIVALLSRFAARSRPTIPDRLALRSRSHSTSPVLSRQ